MPGSIFILSESLKIKESHENAGLRGLRWWLVIQLGLNMCHLCSHVAAGARSIDDEIRELDLFGKGHLGADATQGFSSGHFVSSVKAGHLRLLVGSHHDEFVHSVVSLRFD